jgi:hypothetical protein
MLSAVRHAFLCIIIIALASATLVGLTGCGRVAPSEAPGALHVDSEPAGAAIWLDGRDTGHVTPHTFTDLEAGDYVVTVVLQGYAPEPGSSDVTVAPLGEHRRSFTLSATVLAVDSDPAGARILVDGADTGRLTPAEIGGLEPGVVEVALELDTYASLNDPVLVEIVAGERSEVPATAFAFRPRRVVMLEGFANVGCIPCPQLTANLLALAQKPGFGPDRVLFLEYSVNWPDPSDPLFWGNDTENTDRYLDYLVLGAPALYVDGVAQADPVDADAVEAAVAAGWNADPGVFIDVTMDRRQDPVPVTVTLTPRRDVDLTGHHLFVVLYEEIVVYATAPGNNGQTEFHHVFRDRVDEPPLLGALTAGQPQVHQLTLDPHGFGPDGLQAVAFIQDTADWSILQAGAAADAPLATSRRGTAP